ncbi:ML domain-containing protein [Streptomyces lateritius]|uniref:ML domain-containing protein n=1 Tax=Streptomyces lateritius TaxID=67313 RepID=UPI001C8B2A79|nr:ML domain-containing protein [Streptomyces lateritius]MBX9427501.1 ML domain-containing protein [Streptomyces lateritius]
MTLASSASAAPPYYSCPDTAQSGKVTRLSVTDCTHTENYCILEKGRDVTLEMDFLNEVDTKNVTVHFTGQIGTDPERAVPGFDRDGCQYLTCPLSKGQKATYRMTHLVLEQYPLVELVLKVRLEDASGGTLACGLVHAKIQNP